MKKEIEGLKEIAVEVHQFIEERVTSIPDWTSTNNLNELNAEENHSIEGKIPIRDAHHACILRL